MPTQHAPPPPHTHTLNYRRANAMTAIQNGTMKHTVSSQQSQQIQQSWPSSKHPMIPKGHENIIYIIVEGCVCVRACVRASERACMRVCIYVHACVRACVYACVCVCACTRVSVVACLHMCVFFHTDVLPHSFVYTSNHHTFLKIRQKRNLQRKSSR